MFWYRQAKQTLTSKDMQENLTYQVYIKNSEKRDIEKLFARCFSREDGKKVLAYLHYITFCRAANASMSEAELRHMEGQRALLSTILRLVDLGRS